MTIEKAIEVLTTYNKHGIAPSRETREEAVALGIEALKAVKHNRHAFIIDYQTTLPGETKE